MKRLTTTVVSRLSSARSSASFNLLSKPSSLKSRSLQHTILSKANAPTSLINTASFSTTAGASTTSMPKRRDIDFSLLQVTRSSNLKPKPANETLKFGQTMSDHMLSIDWNEKTGWDVPQILPYGPLSISPAASVLHYALECFEGLKAYNDQTTGEIRLFRPMKNMLRMNHSANRILLPQFNSEELLKCIEELIRIDREWIPRGYGYSLYIRPTLISTQEYIGVQPPATAKLFVILSPVGPYYPEGFNPVRLFADPVHVRAWAGGTGNCKIGGNYALGIRPAMEAQKKGYQQILWIYGPDKLVTEVGTMNQFFFWKNEKTGRKELVTAPLDGTILDGVTRDSILTLCREWNEFDVSERHYTLDEVIAAVESGRMIEAFGAGTAAIVSPVNGFSWNNKDYAIPIDKSNPQAKAGKLTQRLLDTIMGIQYGKIKHPWSHVVKQN